MNKLILFITVCSVLVGCNSEDGDSKAWLQQIGGGGPELVFDLVRTPDGRICATGSFWATVTFGDGEVTKTMSTDGTQDIFVACYKADGQLSAATQFGTHRGDDARAIATFANGDVVITGLFAREFGAGASAALKANDSADLFLTRLDAQGNEVWARQLGGSGADLGTALAVTEDGHILLAGSFDGFVTFQQGQRVEKLNSAGSSDAWIIKLTGAGEVVWAKRFGGSGYDQARAIALAPDGDVLVAGIFEKQATIDGLETTISSSGFHDVFVARLGQSDGNAKWLRALGGSRQDTLDGMVSDAQGRVHLTGSYQQQLNAGSLSVESIGSSDIYLARLGVNGAAEHLYSFGSVNTDQVMDIAYDGVDTLYYTGHFQGETDFAPGAAKEIKQSARNGDSNAFLLALDEDGGFKMVRTMGQIGVEMGFAIATYPDGNGVALAGVFNQGADPKIDGIEPLTVRGKSDVFILNIP